MLISGGGTTLRNLLEKIERRELDAEIALVISSSPQAGGLEFARAVGIPTCILERRQFPTTAAYSDRLFDACRPVAADLIVMGGFLKLLVIPGDFENRVINIHPSLIPAFCGQGFYGNRVHEAVISQGAKITGCTVHFVDNRYDHGPILMQAPVPVCEGDTPDTLAARVFAAECELYPQALGLIGEGRVEIHDRQTRILPPAS